MSTIIQDILNSPIDELPIKGIKIQNIDDFFHKGYPYVSGSIPVRGQSNSYQYLFNQAIKYTNGDVIIYEGNSEGKVPFKEYSYNQVMELFNPIDKKTQIDLYEILSDSQKLDDVVFARDMQIIIEDEQQKIIRLSAKGQHGANTYSTLTL